MMPPNSQSVAQISRKTGVCERTLYTWKNIIRERESPCLQIHPILENWSGEDKLAEVIKTAALNEEELSEYCRKKGLYTEQVARWKEMVNEWLLYFRSHLLKHSVVNYSNSRRSPQNRERADALRESPC